MAVSDVFRVHHQTRRRAPQARAVAEACSEFLVSHVEDLVTETGQRTGHHSPSMTVTTHTEQLKTQGQNDCVDITEAVQAAVVKAKITQGLATIFVTGSTAGVTTIEYEPGLVKDLNEALRRLFPEGLRYAHHETGGDDNGFSHLRAAFIGPSLSVPIAEGTLQLGTWQQIVLVDFDTRPRSRSYLIHLLGE